MHISQIGGREKDTNAAAFFDFYRDKVLPRLRSLPTGG